MDTSTSAMSNRKIGNRLGAETLPHVGGARLTLIIVCAVFAVIAASAAASASIGRQLPTAAAQYWPKNGWILQRAAKHFIKDNNFADIANARVVDVPQQALWLTSGSLLLEPTAASSLSLIALHADNNGNTDKARALMRLASELTRRDAASNLWLIEDYAKSGSNSKALEHYDILLRTSTSSIALFLPIMAKNLTDENMLSAFDALLMRDPPWKNEFWAAVVQDGGVSVNAGKLRTRLHKAGIEMQSNHDGLLLQQIIEEGAMAEGAALYTAAADAHGLLVTGGLLANANFDAASILTPFDWKIISGEDYGTNINTESGELVVSAFSGAEGVVAQQLIALQPGSYELSAKLGEGSVPKVTLSIVCGEARGSQSFDENWTVGSEAPITFSTSRDCRNYWLTIVLPPTNDGNDINLRVDAVSLSKLGS